MPTLLLAIDPDRLPTGAEAALRARAPGFEILISADRGDIERVMNEVEIAAAWLPRDLAEHMPRLRWWQLWAAGADWLPNRPGLVAHPVTVTNAVGIHAIQIGEHVFAVLLALARDLPTLVLAQRDRRWLKDDMAGARLFELHGRTLLLVGVGTIGARVAELAGAFGMRVLGVRSHPERAVAGVERMVGIDALDDVLPQADVVVSSVPRTASTMGMFDARRLALLPKGAVFVNVGRGGTVDERALSDALVSGHLRGAALDVTAKEPLPPESPLWAAPGLIITAHTAGQTPRYYERAMGLFLDNLERYIAGRPLRNVIDKAVGL